MPWPTDPTRRAIALENHRRAQQARWLDPVARLLAAEKATAINRQPEYRASMSVKKRRQYAEDPSIAERIAATLKGKASPATPSRIVGLRSAWARRKAFKVARLGRIKAQSKIGKQ